MLSNQELSEIIEELTNNEVSMKSAMLKVLWDDPAADARILPYLERLLYDKTPCLLAIPYRFGEIRWLAAHALAAERAALGIMKPVRLRNVVPPLDTAGVVSHEDKAGINGRGGVEGVLESFAILNEKGYLPRYDLELSYWMEQPTQGVFPTLRARVPALAVMATS